MHDSLERQHNAEVQAMRAAAQTPLPPVPTYTPPRTTYINCVPLAGGVINCTAN